MPTNQAASAATRPDHRTGTLARVLGLLHERSPRSRAELTRVTGLNRSTVGAVAAELARLGLVVEEQPAPGGVGRPSPLVRADSAVTVLTVNPDADALTLGLVGLDGTVHKRVRYPTPVVPSPADTANLVAALVAGMASELADRYAVLGLAVAVPGLVDDAAGVVTDAPHLGWRDEAIADRLTAATGFPCLVANDADVGIRAESRFGAARGLDDVVYLNGSASGIGGGAVVGGRPLRGSRGYAGEFGHLVVDPHGLAYRCGRTGCLETEVDRGRLLAALGVPDASAAELDRRLREPLSPDALTEVRRQLDWLAVGLVSVVHALNPSAVVLGGFLAGLHRADPDRLGAAVHGAGFPAVTEPVTLHTAELGADLLHVGAAELWFSRLLADPVGLAPATHRPGRRPAP